MRHKSHSHSFSRRQGPRLALIKGLMSSLVEHGRIRTTVAKAKELRRHIERAITLGKKGTLNSRRLLISRIGSQDAAGTIMDKLAVHFKARQGGYTRIIKLGQRPGDCAEMAFIEFVDYKLPKKSAEETVQGDVESKKLVRSTLRLADKKRRHLRTLQSKARQAARA